MIYDAALLMGHARTGVKKNLRQRQAKSPTPTGWVAGGGLGIVAQVVRLPKSLIKLVCHDKR